MTIGNINTPVLTRATRVFLSHISAVASARHAADGDGAVLLDAAGDEAEEGADFALGAEGGHGLLVDLGALGVEGTWAVVPDPGGGVLGTADEALADGYLSLARLVVSWVADLGGVYLTRLSVGDKVGVVVLAYFAREA